MPTDSCASGAYPPRFDAVAIHRHHVEADVHCAHSAADALHRHEVLQILLPVISPIIVRHA
jgi:hypothetical protein